MQCSVVKGHQFLMPWENRHDLDHFGISETETFDHKSWDLKTPSIERLTMKDLYYFQYHSSHHPDSRMIE